MDKTEFNIRLNQHIVPVAVLIQKTWLGNRTMVKKEREECRPAALTQGERNEGGLKTDISPIDALMACVMRLDSPPTSDI
jgi:hypothetical protein